MDISISKLVTETNQAVREEIRKVSRQPEVEDAPKPVSKLKEKFAEIARELAMDDAEPESEPEEIETDVENPGSSTEDAETRLPVFTAIKDPDVISMEVDDAELEDCGEYLQDERGLHTTHWLVRYLARQPMTRWIGERMKSRPNNIGKAG